MGSHQPIRKLVAPEIPDKLYFRIGDVAKLCAVPAYVLRFWETEFPQLKPNKGGTGQRLYRKRDVEMALKVKSLLYDQGFTIPGARQILKGETRDTRGSALEAQPAEASTAPGSFEPARPSVHREPQLQAIRNELQALLGILSRPAGATSVHAGPAKVTSMRPRLQLEPRPTPLAAEKAAAPRPTLLQRDQGDLFGADTEPDIPA